MECGLARRIKDKSKLQLAEWIRVRAQLHPKSDDLVIVLNKRKSHTAWEKRLSRLGKVSSWGYEARVVFHLSVPLGKLLKPARPHALPGGHRGKW